MRWVVERIINYPDGDSWGHGNTHGGFHDSSGNLYHLSYRQNWMGLLRPDDTFAWTAGGEDKELCSRHISVPLDSPMYLTDCADGCLLVSCNGTNSVVEINPLAGAARILIDGSCYAVKNMGNCLCDPDGELWVNDFTGCRILRFSRDGELQMTVGNGLPGFQRETVPTEHAQFSWAYDIRLGPEGNVYVLDSKNFSVRMIDKSQKVVSLVAGTGEPGYSGDGGCPLKARFGGSEEEHFDGPWALSLDERGNIYVGDTQNHVLRMIDRSANTISTIAGGRAQSSLKCRNPMVDNPLDLSLPKICSLEFWDNRLFVPEWDGDLVVLKKVEEDGVFGG
jgi:hypothetical protein